MWHGVQMIDLETNSMEIQVSASKLGFSVSDTCTDYTLVGCDRTEVLLPSHALGSALCLVLATEIS